ncbi:MAG TPA: CBS domain-containing protein [Anaerolineae bacterium]
MSLEQELQAEKVAHLDLSGFCQLSSGTTVRDGLEKMRQAGHNVALVIDNNNLIGVFTDRDVLRKVATAPKTWDQPVDEVMTPNPVTVSPDSSAADALWLMDDRHFRNLPVVHQDGTILGNMTHRAVIEYLAARYPVEVLNRPLRPDQFPRKAEGG